MTPARTDATVTITLPLWVAVIVHEVLFEEYQKTLPPHFVPDHQEHEFATRNEATDLATDILTAVLPGIYARQDAVRAHEENRS